MFAKGWFGMGECWVRGNRRVFALAASLPLLASLVACAGLIAAALFAVEDSPGWRVVFYVGAATCLAIGLYAAGAALYVMNVPRIAYHEGRVLVYLRPAKPESLPVEAVECFFLGREPVEVGSRPSRISNIVVRVAEAERELRQRTDATRFGAWRDGYIIVSGAWCETITPDLMKQLNARLAEAHRERKSTALPTEAIA